MESGSFQGLFSPDFDLDPGRSFCGECERFCGTFRNADKPSHWNLCGDGVAGVGSLGHGPASLILGPGLLRTPLHLALFSFSLYMRSIVFFGSKPAVETTKSHLPAGTSCSPD